MNEFFDQIEPSKFSKIFDCRIENLLYSARFSRFFGHSLEFGVWKGKTLNALAKEFPKENFFGFDSFKGLPEEWIRSFDCTRRSKKGDFKLDLLPDFLENISIEVGYFTESVPLWRSRVEGEISLMHIDSDLYSSAIFVLNELNDRIVPGTVIVFDEFRDWNDQGVYDRWREGEAEALKKWCIDKKREFHLLSRTNWIEGSIVVTK